MFNDSHGPAARPGWLSVIGRRGPGAAGRGVQDPGEGHPHRIPGGTVPVTLLTE